MLSATARTATTPDGALQMFAEAISARLELPACRYEAFPFAVLLPRIERDRIVLPPDEPGVRSYADWLPADGIELPVRYGSLTIGRFVLVPSSPTCGVAIPPRLRADALDIAERAGVALVRPWVTTDGRVGAERGNPS